MKNSCIHSESHLAPVVFPLGSQTGIVLYEAIGLHRNQSSFIVIRIFSEFLLVAEYGAELRDLTFITPE